MYASLIQEGRNNNIFVMRTLHRLSLFFNIYIFNLYAWFDTFRCRIFTKKLCHVYCLRRKIHESKHYGDMT